MSPYVGHHLPLNLQKMCVHRTHATFLQDLTEGVTEMPSAGGAWITRPQEEGTAANGVTGPGLPAWTSRPFPRVCYFLCGPEAEGGSPRGPILGAQVCSHPQRATAPGGQAAASQKSQSAGRTWTLSRSLRQT